VAGRSAHTYVLVKWQVTLIDDVFCTFTLGQQTERRVCDREELHQQVGRGGLQALSYSVDGVLGLFQHVPLCRAL
jgi:hypothetical protein